MNERFDPRGRDVAAFEQRARSYETGWRGRLHSEITTRTAALAEGSVSDPRRVLDVGCGTGRLLRLLATTFPGASELRGIDPAPSMIAVAVTAANDERLRFESGRAEQLPYPDGHFDLVLAVTSFDHWIDQRAGLREVGRILGAGGHLVLVDVFSALLTPTLVGDRRTKTRTRQRAERLLGAAGFASPTWHNLYTPIIKAVTAVSPDTTRIGPSPD